jgi:hypothetical protein
MRFSHKSLERFSLMGLSYEKPYLHRLDALTEEPIWNNGGPDIFLNILGKEIK